jgi:hypothetical protein
VLPPLAKDLFKFVSEMFRSKKGKKFLKTFFQKQISELIQIWRENFDFQLKLTKLNGQSIDLKE